MNASDHKFPIFIEGEFIYLRKVTVNDSGFIYDMRTSDVAQYLNQPEGYSLEMQRKWIESRTSAEVNYIICDKGTRESVGMIGIVDVDWQNKVSSVGRLLILPKYIQQKTPYGVEALKITYWYVFEVLKFRKITGVILARNERVFGLQSYLGMTQEGYLRKHVMLRGKTEDEYVMSLMAEDYPGYVAKIDKILEKYR